MEMEEKRDLIEGSADMQVARQEMHVSIILFAWKPMQG